MHTAQQENFSKIDFSPPVLADSSESMLSGNQRSEKKYLVFYLTDEIFAVSARQVSEVVSMPAITPLPGVPEWLLGIVNLRGEIIAVADLPKLWNKKSFQLSSKTKLIVVRGAESNASIAFTSDKLGEIVALHDSEIRTDKENSTEIFGQALYKSKILNLLDAEKLIYSLANLKIAQSF